MADAAGAAVWRWDQVEPFGVNVPDENPSGPGAFEFPLRFPGQYADKETGLHYNYFRDYDPARGGYLQGDPIGTATTWPDAPATRLNHLYAYVESQPIEKIDPLGLQSLSPFGEGQSGGLPAGPQNPTYQPQPYSRGLNPYEQCMGDCLQRNAKRQLVQTAAVQGTSYGALGSAAAAGQPGLAVLIQAFRQSMQRIVSTYWPVGVIGYPTWWVTSCNDECQCKRN